jgi:asparagine synthase (glutamine-hydrolysing)
MLNSLEMRVPYLDSRLTAYVGQIPPEVLLKNGQKWILKALLKKFKGDKYIHRPKEGFGFPFGLWIKKSAHRNIVDKMMNQRNLIFNFIGRDKVKKIVHDHLSNREDNSHEIWSLLILSRWVEINFN